MPFDQVNYLAVIVCAIASEVIGALWFSPLLFAKQWMSALGIKPEDMEAMKKYAMKGYIAAFVCAFIGAFAAAILIIRIDVGTIFGGMRLGAFVWLGFALTTALPATIFEGRKLKLLLINQAYYLIVFVLTGLILVAWK